MGVRGMLDSETRRKLSELGVAELALAFDGQSGPDFAAFPFEERIQHAVDSAWSIKNNSRIKSLVKLAYLRFPEADINRVIYDERRPLERHTMLDLARCSFIATATNIVINGLSGTGKSWLGSMIAKEACKLTIRSRYIRVPDLMVEWEDALSRNQGVKKLLRKYGNYKVLVLDEWLLEMPDERQCHFLLELIERRYNESPTILCTQFQKKDWHIRLGGGVLADAVMDRIVHNCIWLETGQFNVREYVAKRHEALVSAMPERRL